jgi:hypothetical protein
MRTTLGAVGPEIGAWSPQINALTLHAYRSTLRGKVSWSHVIRADWGFYGTLRVLTVGGVRTSCCLLQSVLAATSTRRPTIWLSYRGVNFDRSA